MASHLPRFAALFILTLCTNGAIADQPPPKLPQPQPAPHIVRITKLLHETRFDSKPFTEKMPLPEMLKRVESQWPAALKLRIRFDEAAFGKDAAKLLKVRVGLYPSPPAKVELWTVLDWICLDLRKESKLAVDFGIGMDEIVITTPRQAAYSTAYDLRDILPTLEATLPNLSRTLKESFTLAGSAAETTLLQYTFSFLQLRLGEAIHLRNGVAFVAHLSPAKHEELASVLASLRRLADVAIVLQARVYDVDAKYYDERILPLLKDVKLETPRPVAPLSAREGLAETLPKQRLALEGEEVKIRAGRKATLASRHEAFQSRDNQRDLFKGQPLDRDTRKAKLHVGTTGFAVLVRAQVSADRRYVRLELTQKIDELVESRKLRFGDPAIGYEEIEEPSLRHTSIATSITLPDGQPFLLPLAYQPPGSNRRRWLLVAEPRIYIEEEERQLRLAEKKQPDKQ